MKKGITDMELTIIVSLLMALVILSILLSVADNQLFVSERGVEIERGKMYTAPHEDAGCEAQAYDYVGDIRCLKSST